MLFMIKKNTDLINDKTMEEVCSISMQRTAVNGISYMPRNTIIRKRVYVC